jgi:hypothetical protein
MRRVVASVGAVVTALACVIGTTVSVEGEDWGRLDQHASHVRIARL